LCINRSSNSYKLTKRFTQEIPRDILEDLYVNKNMSCKEIAEVFGCSKDCINNRLRLFNIPLRVRNYSDSIILTKEALYTMYVLEKKSQKEIAKIINRSQTYVRSKMEEFGIEARDSGIAQAMKRGFSINEQFFFSWSKEFAYLLGLLFADGSISSGKKYSIKLQLKDQDYELLEKIADLINYPKNSIKLIINKQFNTRHRAIVFNRRDIVNQLMKCGLTAKKSKTKKFPDVPDEYLSDFIRGYFDGNGTVYICRNNLCFGFSCGSKDFITKLHEIVLMHVNSFVKVFVDKRTGNNNYSFIIAGNHCAKEFYNFIYTHPYLFLERKKRVFESKLC
jgi:predicted DNA-binding protein YlxM (UPF0122 family)